MWFPAYRQRVSTNDLNAQPVTVRTIVSALIIFSVIALVVIGIVLSLVAKSNRDAELDRQVNDSYCRLVPEDCQG